MKLDRLAGMSVRRGRAAVCIFVVAALLAACGEREQPTAVSTGAASLAELRAADPDANRLLGGGLAEFRRRLAAARGRPVVVNQWRRGAVHAGTSSLSCSTKR